MSTQPLMIKAICTRCGRTSLVKIQLPKMKLPLCMVCWLDILPSLNGGDSYS